jgi:hypothetical protein
MIFTTNFKGYRKKICEVEFSTIKENMHSHVLGRSIKIKQFKRIKNYFYFIIILISEFKYESSNLNRQLPIS